MILRRLDLPRIGLGAAVAGGLGLALALALLRQAEARADPGPTAAALDDALALGSAQGSASRWELRSARYPFGTGRAPWPAFWPD